MYGIIGENIEMTRNVRYGHRQGLVEVSAVLPILRYAWPWLQSCDLRDLPPVAEIPINERSGRSARRLASINQNRPKNMQFKAKNAFLAAIRIWVSQTFRELEKLEPIWIRFAVLRREDIEGMLTVTGNYLTENLTIRLSPSDAAKKLIAEAKKKEREYWNEEKTVIEHLKALANGTWNVFG